MSKNYETWEIFAEIVKLMTHTGFWDSKLVLYYPQDLLLELWARTASKYMLLTETDFIWSIMFLLLEEDFFNYLVIVPWSTVFGCFCDQFEIVKHKFSH